MKNFVAIFLLTLGLIPIIAILFITLQDWYRRKKHPRYFELYRVGMDASKQVHEYFVKNVEPFDNVVGIFTRAHNDGVISDEQFLAVTPVMTEAFNTYKNKYESMLAESKLLWSAVNKYAVDHDLKWGKVL